MIVRKAWSLIFLLVIIGIMFEIFVAEMSRLMPYIIMGAGVLAGLGVLFLIARYFYARERQF